MNTFPGTALQRATAAAIKAGTPICFASDPGQGKSATLLSWLNAWGLHTEVVAAGNREPADFMGLPVLDEHGHTAYAPLGWATRLVNARRSALFLDEANHGAEDTMKALHRVIEERFVGDTPLPPHTAIIAAINPPSVATGAVELPAAVANRMMHLRWVPDFDAWAAGLVSGFDTITVPSVTELAPGGTTFDRQREATLAATYLRQNEPARNACPDDGTAAAGPWPSTRTWTKMVATLAQLHERDADARQLVMNGLIGEPAARPYRDFVRRNRLIDPAAALANPSIVAWDRTSPDVLWALGLGVAALAAQDPTGATHTAGLNLSVSACRAGFADNGWFIARKLLATLPAGVAIPRAVQAEYRARFVEIGLLAA